MRITGVRIRTMGTGPGRALRSCRPDVPDHATVTPRPAWVTHPASLAVTTAFLRAAGRVQPSWCGGASPTRDTARRRAGAPAEEPPA